MYKIILSSQKHDLKFASHDLIEKLNEILCDKNFDEDLYFYLSIQQDYGIIDFSQFDSKCFRKFVSNNSTECFYKFDNDNVLYQNYEIAHFSKFDINLSEMENMQPIETELYKLIITHLYSRGFDLTDYLDKFEINLIKV